MEILFATGNKHKLGEANSIGKKFGVKFRKVDVPYPEIRDTDVARVAEAGAKFVFEKIKNPVIVEDSGLYIEALDGFPCTYSKFVFEKIGNEGILKLMETKDNKNAKFKSAIGYCDGKVVKVFVGIVEGKITKNVKGSSGFGYDPIFVPRGQKKTFAEDYELKNRISHRNTAITELCEWLVKR